MSDALYRIEDEPRPGALAHLVVSPMPILLAAMLGGPWLAWPWFVLNGIALGSPTLRRELAVVAVGVAGAAAITAATVTLIGGGVVEDATRWLVYRRLGNGRYCGWSRRHRMARVELRLPGVVGHNCGRSTSLGVCAGNRYCRRCRS